MSRSGFLIGIFYIAVKWVWELDTIVKMDHSTGKLYTDLYSKPTDAHNYLPADSYHPPHCIKSLPYSQILRLKRICTKNDDFIKHTRDMKTYFKRQGYSDKLFDNAFDKVKDLDRHTLLHGERHVNHDTTIPIPLITTYGTGMPNITQIMRKHWPILMSSPLVKEVLPNTPTVAYRRPPNLKDQLVRAQVRYPPSEAEIMYKEKRCTRLFCKYCKILKNQTTYKCPHTGEIVTLAENVHCQSTNVVYLLYCKQHKTQYVGETKRCFKIRLEEHLADIRHNRDKPVSNHYSSKPHSKKEPEYYILAHLMGDPEKSQQRRRQIERNWIYTLKSFTPYGLNTMGK